MSGLSLKQLERLKNEMVPTPPFLDQLIVEKQEAQRLKASLRIMRFDWLKKAESSASARDSSVQPPVRAAHARHIQEHQEVVERINHILEINDG